MGSRGRYLPLFPAAAAVLAFGATPAGAGTIGVTTTADQYDRGAGCSLREAIAAANTDADFGGCNDTGGDDVVRLESEEYTLTREGADEDAGVRGDLDITGDLEIRGAGPGATTVDGNRSDRVFEGDTGAALTFVGLTVRDGRPPQFNAGGILSTGPSLTVRDCVIRDNRSTGGAGGILARGEVKIIKSVIRGNRATNNTTGGGIFHSPPGSLTIKRSTIAENKASSSGGVNTNPGDAFIFRSVIRDNEAEVDGGGIGHLAGVLTLSESKVRGNTAGETGGGIYGLAADVIVSGSTVSGNQAGQTGGGLFTEGAGLMILTMDTFNDNEATAGGGLGIESNGDAALRNSTVSGNRARSNGGGIYLNDNDAELTVNNSTIAGNVADSDQVGGGSGGGLYNLDGAPLIYNSVLGDNRVAGLGGGEPDCDGGIGLVYSLLENDCPGLGSNNVVGQDPMLKDLAANGGQTKTHALRAASPALEIGDPDTPGTTEFDCFVADQRGEPRPGGPRCDAGAYERQP